MSGSLRRAFAARSLSVWFLSGCVGLAACGGEPKTPPPDSASAQPTTAAPAVAPPLTSAPASAPTPITGTTHDVRMMGDATGYRFEPASLTIKAGDGVRWTMVSGGPHNVSFWPDSIPTGAVTQLSGAMAKQISPLTGPLLMQPNETYTISFAGASKGTYHYFCTPHLALKMRGTITVQ